MMDAAALLAMTTLLAFSYIKDLDDEQGKRAFTIAIAIAIMFSGVSIIKFIVLDVEWITCNIIWQYMLVNMVVICVHQAVADLMKDG